LFFFIGFKIEVRCCFANAKLAVSLNMKEEKTGNSTARTMLNSGDPVDISVWLSARRFRSVVEKEIRRLFPRTKERQRKIKSIVTIEENIASMIERNKSVLNIK